MVKHRKNFFTINFSLIYSKIRVKVANPELESFVFPILNPNRDYSTEAELLIEISRKNALINKYLKKICSLAGINKEVSFHSARHTFANLGRRKIKDVYAISKLLRHSKINITEKYLSEFDTETTYKALESIFGWHFVQSSRFSCNCTFCKICNFAVTLTMKQVDP